MPRRSCTKLRSSPTDAPVTSPATPVAVGSGGAAGDHAPGVVAPAPAAVRSGGAAGDHALGVVAPDGDGGIQESCQLPAE